MDHKPDFFHVGTGGAERMLELVLAALEPGIFRFFFSGEVVVVLSMNAEHGAASRGGGRSIL